MKPKTQHSEFLKFDAATIELLPDLSLTEIIAYKRVAAYTEMCGCYDRPLSDMAYWLRASDYTARRTLQSLVAAGLLIEEMTNGKPTSYKTKPLAKCNPSQNATPCKMQPHPSQNATPIIIDIIDNREIDKNAHACEEKEPTKNAHAAKSEKYPFEDFWNGYGKKVERAAAERMWKRLTEKDKAEIMERYPAYVEATPDRQFRMNPATYLNPANRRWQDEIITRTQRTAPQNTQHYATNQRNSKFADINETINAIRAGINAANTERSLGNQSSL